MKLKIIYTCVSYIHKPSFINWKVEPMRPKNQLENGRYPFSGTTRMSLRSCQHEEFKNKRNIFTTSTLVVFNTSFFKIIIKNYFIYNNSIIKNISILWDFIKITVVHYFKIYSCPTTGP